MCMRRFFALLFLALLLMSSTFTTDWKTALFSWLPSFLQGKAAAEDERAASVFIPDEAAWHSNRTVAQTAYQFDWPFPTMNAEQSAENWRLAQRTIQLTAGSHPILPLAKGKTIRLLYPQGDMPIYLSNLLHAYAPTVEIALPKNASQLPEEILPLPTVVFWDAGRLDVAQRDDWKLLQQLDSQQAVVLLWFGTRDEIPDLPSHWTLLHCPKRTMESESLFASVLFGAEQADKIPSISTVAFRPQYQQLGYAPPLSMGFEAEELQKVDRIIQQAIRKKAMPGAQLLVARAGKIVYQKSYGYHTYQKKQAVYSSDLYDLASVTKAAATSLAVMKLYDQGKITLQQRVSDFLPLLKKRALGYYSIEQLLVHQTGVQADLPVSPFIGKQFVAAQHSESFSIPIGPQRWLATEVPVALRESLHKVSYTKRPMYRYSDINYLLLQCIVEAVAQKPMDEFLAEEVYQPLGLGRLLFKPQQYFDVSQTVPTATDDWMRGGLLRGYVHDEGAALLGGVAGHAGLFGNATDLATLFQLLLNGGELNGQCVFSPSTVDLFTQKSRLNYRSLGFDRVLAGWPNLRQAGVGEQTFGHLGFSGTSVWADPDNQLIYVLLTNRIHPDPKSDTFSQLDVRGKVHQQIYKSLRLGS